MGQEPDISCRTEGEPVCAWSTDNMYSNQSFGSTKTWSVTKGTAYKGYKDHKQLQKMKKDDMRTICDEVS